MCKETVKELKGDEVERRFNAALDTLIDLDKDLLVKNVNERSITHKLAEYLAREFDDWDVDCEYNRNFDETKRLDSLRDLLKVAGLELKGDDTNGVTVFPDIIIHRRGREENLLVIEVKKTTNKINREFDLYKLESFHQDLEYRFSAFVEFRTETPEPRIEKKLWEDREA